MSAGPYPATICTVNVGMQDPERMVTTPNEEEHAMEKQTSVGSGPVGAVSGGTVNVRNAAVGAIAARDVALTNGGAGAIAAAGDVHITNGGSGPMAVAGDVSIMNGGAQTIAALGGATLQERSFVAFVLAPKVTIEDGARVLMTPRAAAGAAIAIAGLLLGEVARWLGDARRCHGHARMPRAWRRSRRPPPRPTPRG